MTATGPLPPDEPAEAAPSARAWQRMLSGRRLDLLDPSPADIEIVDIAHGLARVARWNGQTVGPHALSVAQHSLIVEQIASHMAPELTNRERLAALLHDAPEYVIGDLISPFKAAVGHTYKAFEARLLAAIHTRYDLPHPPPSTLQTLIKQADRLAAYFEATALAGFGEAEALLYFGSPDGLDGVLEAELRRITPMPAAEVQPAFLVQFGELAGDGEGCP